MNQKELEAAAAAGTLEFVSNESRLPPLPYDWGGMFDHCVRLSQTKYDDQTKIPRIRIPVNEPETTRRNKVRLVPDDRTSPMGVIVRNDPYAHLQYSPYAVGEFDLYEMLKWLSLKVLEQAGETVNAD